MQRRHISKLRRRRAAGSHASAGSSRRRCRGMCPPDERRQLPARPGPVPRAHQPHSGPLGPPGAPPARRTRRAGEGAAPRQRRQRERQERQPPPSMRRAHAAGCAEARGRRGGGVQRRGRGARDRLVVLQRPAGAARRLPGRLHECRGRERSRGGAWRLLLRRSRQGPPCACSEACAGLEQAVHVWRSNGSAAWARDSSAQGQRSPAPRLRCPEAGTRPRPPSARLPWPSCPAAASPCRSESPPRAHLAAPVERSATGLGGELLPGRRPCCASGGSRRAPDANRRCGVRGQATGQAWASRGGRHALRGRPPPAAAAGGGSWRRQQAAAVWEAGGAAPSRLLPGGQQQPLRRTGSVGGVAGPSWGQGSVQGGAGMAPVAAAQGRVRLLESIALQLPLAPLPDRSSLEYTGLLARKT